MIIYVDKDGKVDLEAPIHMTDEQREIFSSGMKEIFGKLAIYNIEELEKNMSETERNPRKWLPEELLYLLEDKTHEEVASILKREPFGVRIKRGIWVGPFQAWALKKGYIKAGKIINTREAIFEYESSQERED